jgi:predicted dehydrogenase
LSTLATNKLRLAREAGDVDAANRLETRYNELNGDIEAARGTLHDEDRPRFIHYVDLSNNSEQCWLDRIRADVVFVLVPDKDHIRVARRWLKRATLILIEKPYDREYTVADAFEKELSTMISATDQSTRDSLPGTVVSPFDHYLAKIHEYVQNRDTANRLTGPLQKIEFALVEAGPVERWRAETLSAGMIYDLLSHVFAMLSVELDLRTFQLQNRRTKIAVARHAGLEDSPYKAETFATFEFIMNSYSGAAVEVRGSVGKGVGKQDMKHITLVGRDSTLRMELGRLKPGIFTQDRDVKIFNIYQGHPEFVESIVDGRFQDEKIGWLKGDVSLSILRSIGDIRRSIDGNMHIYKTGTSIEEISREATPLFPRAMRGAA